MRIYKVGDRFRLGFWDIIAQKFYYREYLLCLIGDRLDNRVLLIDLKTGISFRSTHSEGGIKVNNYNYIIEKEFIDRIIKFDDISNNFICDFIEDNKYKNVCSKTGVYAPIPERIEYFLWDVG